MWFLHFHFLKEVGGFDYAQLLPGNAVENNFYFVKEKANRITGLN